MLGKEPFSRRRAVFSLIGGMSAVVLAACGGGTATPAAPAAGNTTGGAANTGNTAAKTTPAANNAAPAQTAQKAEIHVNFREGSDAEWQQKLIPAFQQKNPNITVKLDVLPGEPEYWAKVQALYSTGQIGDMVWASLGNYFNFADKGIFNALDPIISKDKYDVGDYYNGALDSMKWNGKQFGMPWGAHTGNVAIMYNANLLDEAGIKPDDLNKSYDALYEAAQKLTKGPAGNRTQFGFLPASGQIGMNVTIRSFGGEFMDKAGKKLLLSEPAAMDAIKWIQKMWADTAPTFGSGFSGDEYFANGRVAMTQAWWGSQFTPGDKAIAGKFKWDFVQMPKGPKGVVGTQFTINGIAMSGITKQPDATWTYMKYMMDPAVQVEIVSNNGGRPAPRKAVLENQELLSKLKAPKVFVPLYQNAMPWAEPANHRWPEFNTAVDQVFGPIWTGAATLDAGMKDATSKLQEILDKPKA